MKNSPIRTVVALAFVAVVALFWWSRRDDPRAEPVPAEPNDAATTAKPAEPLAAPAAGVSPTIERTSSPPNPVRANAVADSGDPDAEGQWTVKTVDEADVPVPGAVVRWKQGATFIDLKDPSRPFSSVDARGLVDAEGPHLVTGADGHAFLPRDALPGLVVARQGDRSGGIFVYDRSTPEFTIRLERDHDLEIVVVDPEGKPVAGVPVAIRSLQQNAGDPLWKGMTAGSEGRVRPAELERELRRSRVPRDNLIAWLPIPCRTIVSAPVDLENSRRIVLTLPPCGSVEVLLRDANDQPARVGRVQLAPSTALNKRGQIGYESIEFDPVELEKGRAFYPFVEVGLDLHAEAGVVLGFDRTSTDGRGPARVGELVTFRLEVKAQTTRIFGRLLASDRSPVASVLLQGSVSWKSSGGAMGSWGAPFGRTDADGRFESILTTYVAKDAEVQVELSFPTPDASGHVRTSTTATMPSDSNDLDLGDVFVRPPDVIATGRVVDESGASLDGWALGVVLPWKKPDGSETWSGGAPLNVVKGPDVGAFRIEGWQTVPRMRIGATKPGYAQSKACEITMGTRDAVVVLERAASIRGRVLADDAATLERLSILIRRATGDTDVNPMLPFGERRKPRPDGTFEFADLKRGSVDVEFRVPGSKEPVHVLRGVDVRAPGPATDRRLAEVDLRGLVPAVPPLPTQR